MSIRSVVEGFPGVSPLTGLDDAWHWSPVPGIHFAGVLSTDGQRLLQVTGNGTFEETLAVATLEFARDHEKDLFAVNPHLGAAEGFRAPAGYAFDSVAGAAPEVHRYYEVEHPGLDPLVRVVFPAYACEFSGREDLDAALTRYDMMSIALTAREPEPFLKMSFDNTRDGVRSTNPGRAFAEEDDLLEALEDLVGAQDSFVEFENRRGGVWRATFHDSLLLAELTEGEGTPRETTLEALLAFAAERLRD